MSGHEHDLAQGVTLSQVAIRRLNIVQRVDVRDGDHYLALANSFGEVRQERTRSPSLSMALPPSAFTPYFAGAVKVGDGIDAFRANAEGDRQLYVIRTIGVDEGVDWSLGDGPDAVRHTVAIRDGDDATQLEPWMMCGAREARRSVRRWSLVISVPEGSRANAAP